MKEIIEKLVSENTLNFGKCKTLEDYAELENNFVEKLLAAINYTHSCETLKEISKIVDKIVEETPLLCMPDDKQMQRDCLKEKWTNWFKKEYNL